MSGLTKGNWIAFQHDNQKAEHSAQKSIGIENAYGIHGCGEDGAYMLVGGFCSEADAMAMAAAPELLEAMQEAVKNYGKGGGPWNVPSDPGGWLIRARAAITKATGDAP